MSDVNTTGIGTSTGVGVGSVEGVVLGAGFVGGGVGELGGVGGGPFVTVNVVDSVGVVVGCVAVADSGDGSDGLVEGFGVAAGVELGGSVVSGPPVGSVSELGSRFEVPVSVRVWDGVDGSVGVVFVTTADRRNQTTTTTAAASVGSGFGGGLDKLVNVALDVSVELGRTTVTLADVLDYDVGSVVELDRAAGAPVDIRVNGTLLAQGEVVLIDDEYAVRITAIIEPHQT